MSVLEIDINRETRRAQIFRARFHAAIGDSAPLEDIPTDDLTNAHHRLQTRARQGDPNGWAWVHTTLVEAELRRRHKPPTNRPVDIVPTPCGNDENKAPAAKLDPPKRTAPASVVRATQVVPGPGHQNDLSRRSN